MACVRPGADEHEDTLVLAGRELRVVRPRDADALIDEHAFAHEEYLPYWAELWPSGVALARAVAIRSLRGARTLELGCGLGLPSLAAALAGGRALATDWAPDAIAYAAANAQRNGVALETLVCAWADPDPIVARGPWDLVLAADVLYEQRNVDLLLGLLPRLVAPGGELWLADPGRPPAARFLAGARGGWERASRLLAAAPPVTLHTLTRR